jgi:hypothetical protein
LFVVESGRPDRDEDMRVAEELVFGKEKVTSGISPTSRRRPGWRA